MLTTFGRDRELTVLRAVISSAADGIGGCAVVTGPPGIGKSHLLREVIKDAEPRGVAVAMRETSEYDRAAPFTTLASTLRRIQPVTTAFDWLRETRDDGYPTLEMLATTLGEHAAGQPLVIVIDDAQWMDEFSVLAVRELVTTLASSPVYWLFARRPAPLDTPGQQFVQRLVAAGTAQETRLGALGDDAVARLCAQVVGAEVDNTVLALTGWCDGNPLEIEQLIRTLTLTGQLVVSDGVATVVGGELPSSFITIVEQTLERLGTPTRQLLRAGSVFGRPFTVDAVARLLEVNAAAVLPWVDTAMAARVLTDGEEGLDFVHDLFRQAVHATLQPSARALYHRMAAQVTRDEGRSPIEVAEHLLKGGRSTREAVTMLRESALAVAAAAPNTAADLILEALGVVDPAEPARMELIADGVGLLASASRLREASDLGETALHSGLDAATEATVLLGLAEAFKHAGQNGTAVEYADRGLSHVDVPEAVRAKLWAVRAHALFYVDDLAGADCSGRDAYDAGTGAGQSAAAVFGLTARSLVAQAEGRLSDALAHAEEATALADRARGEASHRHPRIWLGNALMTMDRFDEAEAVFRRGRRESEQLGTAWSTPLWHYYTVALLMARGQLEDAVGVAEAGVAAAEDLTAVQLVVPLLGQLTRAAVARAELPQAREHHARMHRLIATGITATPEDVLWTDFVLAAADLQPGFKVPTDLYDTLPERPALIIHNPSAAGTLVRLAMMTGDLARAGVVVSTAERLAAANPTVPSLNAAAAHAKGVLRCDPVLLEAAIRGYRQSPRRVALATALEDAALVTKDAVAAREWRTEALDIATDCGVVALRDRLATSVDDQASRGNPFPKGSRLALLTERELKVAVLVADGMTNPEVAKVLFISRHTVDSHLRKIFVKFEIRGRGSLIKLVGEEKRRYPGSA